MADLPHGTVTFLFTDIEGSTRLLTDLGDRYADALAEHRSVLRQAFRAHRGVEVDTQGDAFFYAFEWAEDAVAAAADAQEALASGPMRVRMGLHTGEPQAIGEGYVGLDVHATARIAGCSHGGQVVLSKRTRELAGDRFAFRDLGEHKLKDLKEAVWLYQLGTASFPPLKSLSNTNLPTPASTFLGREGELAEAERLLRDTRLLTVSGPGGAGKTRFAIELAARQLEEFPNGVFWVSLASLRDPELVVEETAQALGAKNTLATHIAAKRMLLLLDNFEQVVDAAPRLSKLLRACPNLRLIVTSRETLRVEGETEYCLPPLAEDEGVALFYARARVEEDAAVRELCARLDGLPLAIELAAARAKILSPEDLVQRLSTRLDVLIGGRDAESRHATLRATIAWSCELLNGKERQLFARMGVFAGGCTLQAAEEVCGADLDTLQSLLDKSLVRRTGGRFWMLETIREYALEQLAERNEGPDTEAKRTDYFLRFTEEAYPHLRAADQREWLERLDPEHDNIRAALAHARELGDGDIELRLAVAVGPLRLRRGYLSEGRASLEHALSVSGDPTLRATALHQAGFIARVQRLDDEAEILLKEGLRLARELDDHPLTAKALLTLAGLVSERDEAGAQILYDELLVLIAQHPEERFSDAFINLADFAGRRGDFVSARDYSELGVRLLREEGDSWGLAMALGNLGVAQLQLGEKAEAERHFVEALLLVEGIGDAFGTLALLSELGVAAIERDQIQRGIHLLAYVERVVEETEVSLFGSDASFHERAIARARVECRAFESEWSRGRSMTKEQAFIEALGDSAVRARSRAAPSSSPRIDS